MSSADASDLEDVCPQCSRPLAPLLCASHGLGVYMASFPKFGHLKKNPKYDNPYYGDPKRYSNFGKAIVRVWGVDCLG